MLLTPYFLQAAGNIKARNTISFVCTQADLTIYQLSCTGDIVISSVKNGTAVTASYSSLTDTQVAIQADADTLVTITGDVTKIGFYDWDNDDENPINITDLIVEKCKTLTFLDCTFCTGLTELDLSANTALTNLVCSSCTGLTELDLSANTALTEFVCSSCTGLTELDLSANTALTNLNCYFCIGLTELDLSANTALTEFNCNSCTGLTELDLSANTALANLSCTFCTGLTELDLSANTALTNLSCSSCTGLTTIYYPATNSTISTVIANAITNATATDGTVYTDSTAAYYSTIETAANNKGWTIAALS